MPTIPGPRWSAGSGRPEDIAQAAIYLMSGTYVTGQVHEIDGGRP